jgi:hypothetical protein
MQPEKADPIAVTVHFDEQGGLTPLRFTWQGREYQVESTGRRWYTAIGQHILVMAGAGRLFELIFLADAGRWLLARKGAERVAT